LRVHFINTGPEFPYTYYLGITSAVEAFGEKVKLWLVETPSGEYFDRIQDKVEIVSYPWKIPEFPMLEGRGDHFKRVAIFDNCIWRIMMERGGTVMGLDSFTLKPFHDLLKPDKEMLVGLDDPDGIRTKTGWPFCMHGATCRRGSKIAQSIYEDSTRTLFGECPAGRHKAIENGQLRFGGAGIIPFLNHTLQNLDKLSIAGFGLLGGWERGDPLPEFYLWQKDGKLLHPDCRTIPFYATSRKAGFDATNEKTVRDGNTLLSRLVRGQPVYSQLKEVKMSKATSVEKHTFHMIGLSHLPVSSKFPACAFTTKIWRLSKMLMSLGHTVYLYSAEGSDAECTEFVQTHTLKDIRDAWGSGDCRKECDGIGYPYRRVGFRHDLNSARTETTKKYYAKAIEEINKRKKPDDFLLLTQGVYQKPIADGVKLWLTCEPGVGYRGSYTRFRAFESAYLQNFTYGSQNPGKSVNGNYYDRVIPNYFDPADFPFCEDKGDYFLFIGRMISRKGVWTAIKTTQAIGAKLILAGQESNEINVKKLPDHCEFVGYVGPKRRAELMGHAKAVFVPTLYLEAFGGVNVEAQLCGTPVITTNFGCFLETVQSGITGFRCDTLDDFVNAALSVGNLDPHVIRRHAERYSMDNVKFEFEKWFQDLYALYESAQDSNVKGWHRIRSHSQYKGEAWSRL